MRDEVILLSDVVEVLPNFTRRRVMRWLARANVRVELRAGRRVVDADRLRQVFPIIAARLAPDDRDHE